MRRPAPGAGRPADDPRRPARPTSDRSVLPGARLSARRARCSLLARMRHLHQAGIDRRIAHHAGDSAAASAGVARRIVIVIAPAPSRAMRRCVVAGRSRRLPARSRRGAGGAASARSKPAPSARLGASPPTTSGHSVTCISSSASAARNWNSRSPPASTSSRSTPRRGELLEHPGDRRAALARPALGLGAESRARSDAARVTKSGRIAGLAEERRRRAARRASRVTTTFQGRPRRRGAIGGVGQRRMRPVAERRAADEHRVGLGAQPAHARMVARAAEEGEAALARVDAAVERDRGVADDLHRPARDLHAGPFEALHRRALLDRDRDVVDERVLQDDLGQLSATRSISRYSRPCTASISSPARR